MQASRALRVLFEKDRDSFFESALPLLREEPEAPGVQYLTTLFLSHDMLLGKLTDPGVFSLDEANRIAQQLTQVDAQFDVRLLRSAIPNNGRTTPDELEHIAGTPAGVRLIEILGEVSDGTRVMPVMTRLLNHPNSCVRAKAALLVGRGSKNHKWVQERLGESDAGVRANVVESLWGSDDEGSRAVFWTALGDEDDRVVGNAALALYRLGDPLAVRLILQLVAHPDAAFRRRGAWVMGETGDPRFMPALAQIIATPASELRVAAFQAMAKLKKAMARRAVAQPLALAVGRPRRLPDARVEFTVAIRSNCGQEIPRLGAANFAIWEDSVLVREYTVRQRGRHEPAAVALAFPRILDRLGLPQECQERAVERAFEYKRKQDVWTVLKYITMAEERPAFGNYTMMRPGDEDLAAVAMRFTSDVEAITDAVARPGKRLGCAADPRQAVRALIAAASRIRATRNVVLVCQSPLDVIDGDIRDEIDAAVAGKVAVHIVSPWANKMMQTFCARTQGMLLTPAAAADIPAALENLFASLRNWYEVCYEPEIPAASTLRIQVFTDALIGEAAEVPAS